MRRHWNPLYLPLALLLSALSVSAQQPENTERKVQNPIGAAEEERRALRRVNPSNPAARLDIAPNVPRPPEDVLDISADKEEAQGDVIIYSGEVEALYRDARGDLRLSADRLTYNAATRDILAEGNVFLEQQGQVITAERLEFNLDTRRGSFFTPTAFTDRTPDGTTVVVDAERADKTGADTYTLEDARLTACQEPVPKWSFTAKRARIRLDHRATLYHPLFRLKNVPVLYLPFLSLSISKKDRSSGFLLPTSGSSNIKGRTLHAAYYQTLGRSADILFRTDIYSKRGVGFGFDFRARPDEQSRLALGTFAVQDRVLGGKTAPLTDPRCAGLPADPQNPRVCTLPDQGGTSFYADGVQYFKNGFVAVADVNITSSAAFRQVFAENAQQAISPEERSQLYLNRNWRSFSFNANLNEQSFFIGDQIVKTRQLPSFELNKRSERVSESLPFYVSFDAAIEGVRRSETRGDQRLFRTPSMLQRFDLMPRLTFPLKSLAGFTVTPSVAFRSTFYSNSVDPVSRGVLGKNLARNYAEFAADLRPPALARVFRRSDGTPRFKHVIEPFATYRRIAGVDDFARTPLVDERDAVAETNEVEYGVTNRIFVKRPGPDGESSQAHELLAVTVAQKYFFDPTFGGALRPGRRNQFFPLNTFTGFAYGGAERHTSPLYVETRLRPSPALFADVRLNYDTQFSALRQLAVAAGLIRRLFSVSQSWYYTRRVTLDASRPAPVYDPTTFPGNQLDTSAFVGNPQRGPYLGITAAYDLRNQFFDGTPRTRSLINLITTGGWAWDCCSFQVQNVTFRAGLRNENRILFAFTLKGVGTFGTDNIGQSRRR
jgi:LPS-assembly protein